MAAPLDDETAGPPDEGIALCLSGGGYRAMVFHVGALIRMNEIGLRSIVSAEDRCFRAGQPNRAARAQQEGQSLRGRL